MFTTAAPIANDRDESARSTLAARDGAGVPAWIILLAVLAASAAYVYWHLGRGLIAHDDGAIGQAAERILAGELPHRDFDDIYTGGLAWLNAWGFRLLGTSMWSLRVMLLAAFVAWVPAVFYIARRFVQPVAAGAVTLLAVAWSVPNYPAPMPSWYNLFLATAGVAALLRYVERPQRRWLVLAGVAGGLSILIKIVGLYYVAGVLLFLVFQAHESSRATAGPDAPRGIGYAAMVSAALLLFVLALLGLVTRDLRAPELVHFVMPGALIAALLAHDEWTRPAGPSGARFASLAALIGPFLIGIALPVALFAIPYARSSALGTLVYGVFVLPTKRLGGSASVSMLSLSTLRALAPIALLGVAAHRWPSRVTPWVGALLVAALAVLLVATGRSDALYKLTWHSVRSIVPVIAAAGVLLLSRPRAADVADAKPRARMMVLLCVTALCSLVQFPFAVPVYFCYVAPLAVLLVTALLPWVQPMPRVVPAALLAFYLAFAITRINTSSIYGMGYHFMPYLPTQPLGLARGGVSVLPIQAEEYGAVGQLLGAHARGGYTWASPDAPEIYFLTGLRNPTRSLFDFFDDTTHRDERLLATLQAHGVTAIVLNREPEFSRGITNRMFDSLAVRYPASADVGRFHVRWRP